MNDYLLSICIPTYNRSEMVVKLVKHILTINRQDLRVVVMDNNSSDASINKLKEIEDVRLLLVKNSLNVSGSKNTIRALTVFGSKYNLLLIDRDFINVGSILYLMDFLTSNLGVGGVDAGLLTAGSFRSTKAYKYSNNYDFINNVFSDTLPTHPTGWFFMANVINGLRTVSEELLSLQTNDLMYPHVYLLSQVSLKSFIHIKYKDLDYEKSKNIEEINFTKVKSGFIQYNNEITFVESRFIINEVMNYTNIINTLPNSKIRKYLLKLRILHWSLMRSTVIAKIIYKSKVNLDHYGAVQKRIRFSDQLEIYKSFYKLEMYNHNVFMKFFVLIVILNNIFDNTNSVTHKIPRNPIRLFRKIYSKLTNKIYVN